MYLLVLGVIAVVSIAIVLAGRRADRQSEVGRWARATKCLNEMCPPNDESATLWCRVVGTDQGAEEDGVPACDRVAEEDGVPASDWVAEEGGISASAQVATLGTLPAREMPTEIPAQPIGVRRSGADAA